MSSISIVTMYRIYIWFYWTLFLLFLTKNVNLKGVSGCALQTIKFEEHIFFRAIVYINTCSAFLDFQLHYEQKAMRAVFGV